MTGSATLDTVIGLVFIFLLYSLLATIIQEIISTNLSFRAKFLEKAIIRMLEDGKANAADSWLKRIGSFIGMFFRSKKIEQLHVATAFYHHPLIKYLAEDDYKNKPAYLTNENFSKALIDLLRGNEYRAGDDPKEFIEKALDQQKLTWKHSVAIEGLPDEVRLNDETSDYLRSLWADAQGDVEKFRSMIENWFDITMERASGWYKKHVQLVLFMLGFGIAVIFNVDTIELASILSKSPELRNELVRQADTYVKAHKDEFSKDSTSKATADTLLMRANNLLNQEIADANKTLGIGWQCENVKQHAHTCLHSPHFCFWANVNKLSLIGWLITAFAISLGAPFWFDTLNKLMKLRGAVNSGENDKKDKKAPAAQTPKIKG
ncbi:MAG: hypothetical protein K0R65_621 [Crocinitomicaceae bacterium]|jgi:arsenate reductase-like glutaredoxin family protein|nr:hypothetical protein [Crocinitomicaceae bacterium]